MSGGYCQSPASPCWGAGDRRGCPAFPCTDRRHPRVHRLVGRGRRRLTRRPPQGTPHVAPPGPGRPPGRVRRTGAGRALLGPHTDRVSARDALPQTPAPTPARIRRPSSRTGRRATRPAPVCPVPGTRHRSQGGRGHQHGRAPDTSHAGPVRRRGHTLHPPVCTGLPVETGGRTTAAWGLAGRWAWDRLGWPC